MNLFKINGYTIDLNHIVAIGPFIDNGVYHSGISGIFDVFILIPGVKISISNTNMNTTDSIPEVRRSFLKLKSDYDLLVSSWEGTK